MYIPIVGNGFALLIGTLAICTICFSQQKTIIGLNVTGENTSSSDFVVGVGGTFEKQFNKHHGFETGLYYRTFKERAYVFVDGSLFGVITNREQYLSIPVLYKFNSPTLNFSIGPTFDIYVGWKQIKSDFPPIWNTHYVDGKFRVGLMGKISKTIGLTDRILLEPEIRYNRVFFNNILFYGVGISCKYTLSK